MRKTCLLATMISALIVSGCSLKKNESSPKLFPVEVEGRYGYINEKGVPVITPQYDAAGDFSEGLAWVRIDKREGYIDEKGRCVIKPRFTSADDFHEGLAAVKDGTLWGFIDAKENFVIKSQFEQVKRFSEGRACVRVQGAWGYINKQGSIVVRPQYAEALDFSEGLAAVKAYGLAGYIDRQGTYIIKPTFEFVSPFSEGIAIVGSHRSRPGKGITLQWRFINRKGKLQYERQPQYEWPNSFTEGLAAVGIDGKYGYIDKGGRWVIRPSFQAALPFAEGMACVRMDNSWGFIDRTGKIVIEPQFEEPSSGFSRGLAAIPDVGYVDKSGRLVWRSKKEVEPEFVGQYSSISETGDSCAELVVRMEGGEPAAFYRSWYCGEGGEPPDLERLNNVSIDGKVLTGTTPDGYQVTWTMEK